MLAQLHIPVGQYHNAVLAQMAESFGIIYGLLDGRVCMLSAVAVVRASFLHNLMGADEAREILLRVAVACGKNYLKAAVIKYNPPFVFAVNIIQVNETLSENNYPGAVFSEGFERFYYVDEAQ